MRLLMYVAQHPARLCTISEVAQVYDIAETHLMKITHQLALAGWLRGDGCGSGMNCGAYSRQALAVSVSDGLRRLPRRWMSNTPTE